MLPGIFDGFMQSVSNFVPALQSIFGTAKNIIGTIAEAFSGFFSGLTSGFKGGLTGAGGFQTGFMAILGLI